MATRQADDRGGNEQHGNGAADITWKALAAVGTGIGVLGFVTLFGGAILWVRADKAGLPATEAVAAVPKGVLVTTGASFLVPAVLVALLAVTVIAAIHLGFAIPPKLRAIKKRRVVHRTRFETVEAERDAAVKNSAANAADERLERLRTLVSEMRDADDPQAAQLQALTSQQQTEVESHRLEARHAHSTAEQLKMEATVQEAQLTHAQANPPWLDTTQWWVERGTALLVLILVPLIVYGDPFELTGSRPTILLIVAVTAAAVSLAIYVATESFLWLGITAFFAVGIYTGFATYYRTADTLKVQPAAALRSGHSPIAGFFVAETADSYYLGAFQYGGHRPQLRIVPRAQITDVTVGPFLALTEARGQAFRMAKLACHQLVTESRVTHPVHACSKKQELALAREAAAQ